MCCFLLQLETRQISSGSQTNQSLMGNKQGKVGGVSFKGGGSKHVELSELEQHLVKQAFDELASKSFGRISRDSFTKFCGFDGVLGNRLFKLFNEKENDFIHFEQFLNGYRKV